MKKRMFALCLALTLLSGCMETICPPPPPERDNTSVATELTDETPMDSAPIRSEQADRAISALGLDLLNQSREEGKNTGLRHPYHEPPLCLCYRRPGAGRAALPRYL